MPLTRPTGQVTSESPGAACDIEDTLKSRVTRTLPNNVDDFMGMTPKCGDDVVVIDDQQQRDRVWPQQGQIEYSQFQ